MQVWQRERQTIGGRTRITHLWLGAYRSCCCHMYAFVTFLAG